MNPVQKKVLLILFAMAALGLHPSVQAQPSRDVIVLNTPLPVDVTNTTPKPSQIVHLGSGGIGTPCPTFTLGQRFRLAPPDGGPTQAFSIPAGQVLVVTSLSFDIAFGPPSKTVFFRLARDNGSFAAAVFRTRLLIDAAGNGGSTHVTLSTGFIVKSGVDLCVILPNPNSFVGVYGFLAPDI